MAWQKSMDFAVRIYELTRRFAKEELYALTSQLRRAAVSGPSKIAEGQPAGRNNNSRIICLTRSVPSTRIDTQLELALRLGYVTGVNMIARSKRLMSALH
jgi:four helix bundle protein